MISWIIKRLIGTKSDREVKRLRTFVKRISEKERELDALTNKELVELSRELHLKVTSDESLKESILRGDITEDVILAFAIVREAGKRTIGLRFLMFS